VKDYKFGRKNQWRRTLWNQIRARVQVSPAEAVVVYLAGPDNLDRTEAMRRGFKPNNLIAVDRDERIVRTLRHSGQLSIAADFCEVLLAWNPKREVHVVIGDFCSGLENNILCNLGAVASLPSFRNTVFAFNFLRGRDPSSNAFRAAIRDHDPTLGRHRGAFLWRYVEALMQASMADELDPAALLELTARVRHRVNPRTDSYRSGVQTFDSVVWSPWAVGTTQEAFAAAAVFNDALVVAPSLRSKIAATLAHRTMRNNAI